MHIVHVTNVNEAYRIGMNALAAMGQPVKTRNGPARKFSGPTTTIYENPTQRVLFHPTRDANPFFHFYESLWMIVGRDDVKGVANFVKTMENFSDDGATFHGAYGRRWRSWFGLDQVSIICRMLKHDHTDRRAVLQMWDASADLGRNGKDFPCNTQIFFNRNNPEQRLDMTVCCRSNDLIWGAYGANAVHFSMLQEYMAGQIGCAVGSYWQVSNDLHAYDEVFDKLMPTVSSEHVDLYEGPHAIEPYPMYTGVDAATFRHDLELFMENDQFGGLGITSPFLKHVAAPLLRAHTAYKTQKGEARYTAALKEVKACEAADWKAAAEHWLLRRLKKFNGAQDDGVTYA